MQVENLNLSGENGGSAEIITKVGINSNVFMRSFHFTDINQ